MRTDDENSHEDQQDNARHHPDCLKHRRYLQDTETDVGFRHEHECASHVDLDISMPMSRELAGKPLERTTHSSEVWPFTVEVSKDLILDYAVREDSDLALLRRTSYHIVRGIQLLLLLL